VFSVFAVQSLILMVASLAVFVLQAWAFIDAASHRPDAFVAADKMTKKAWLIILGVALAAHMIFWSPISLLNIVGTIACLVYLLDARPVLRSLSRR
jgi:asparagine N-glycosylation enzyme membrane subunit Stt3